MTALLNPHYHPHCLPLPPPLLLLLLLLLHRPNIRCGGSSIRRHCTQFPPSTPAMRTRSKPALFATAPSPHASTWSDTCESIAQRLEHQPTLTASASTALTAPAHSPTAWASSVICVSTTAELTAVSIHLAPLAHPTMPSSKHTPLLSASIINSSITAVAIFETDTDTADFFCPHCHRKFISRIGLVCLLRIHRTETDEPVPGAPSYTRRIRLNCPHCTRTFAHRMGLLAHMRIHENLWQITAS
nr:unnamed protein product [Spirometra erinaceieuropaei]